LAELFNLDETPIDNPKPTKMLKDFVSWFSEEGDIILDFFAGAGSTGHAVTELNLENEVPRSFILVQLPESTKKIKEDGSIVQTTASKAGYKTISELCRERMRRLFKKSDGKLKFDGPVKTQNH